MQSPSFSNCFVANIDLSLAEKLKKDLHAQGFELSQPAHTLFQAKKKRVTCTLYASGKLMVQGKDMREFIQFYLEPEVLGNFSYGYELLNLDLSPRIGVDESGKGDFFGPLCIAGVYAEGDSIKKLAELGVKDSKKMSDSSILKISALIKKSYAYHIVRINPAKYNELYEKFKNLNTLLGWGHATVIENLIEQTKCNDVLIDRFGSEKIVEMALKRKNKSVNLTQKVRAEEDLVVAAASILARAAFLEGLEKLSQTFGFNFPKGASSLSVEIAKTILKQKGIDELKKVCKEHFKTFQQVLQE